MNNYYQDNIHYHLLLRSLYSRFDILHSCLNLNIVHSWGLCISYRRSLIMCRLGYMCRRRSRLCRFDSFGLLNIGNSFLAIMCRLGYKCHRRWQLCSFGSLAVEYNQYNFLILMYNPYYMFHRHLFLNNFDNYFVEYNQYNFQKPK